MIPNMLRSVVPLSFSILALATGNGYSAEAASGLPSDVPANFALGEQRPVSTLHAVGAQIYECKAAADGPLAWSFREPIATLVGEDGRTIGRHYAGPNWDLGDGSGVTGKSVSSAPGAGPGDIPQLALQVVEHRGSGALANTSMVLRLHTAGGALKGACDRAGELRSVPYAADYLFLR